MSSDSPAVQSAASAGRRSTVAAARGRHSPGGRVAAGGARPVVGVGAVVQRGAGACQTGVARRRGSRTCESTPHTRPMQSKELSDYKGSAAQTAKHEQWTVERVRSFLDDCPECGGGVVAGRDASFCGACGLVVSQAHVDDESTRGDPARVGYANGTSGKAVTPFRTNKGLHTIIQLDVDGAGSPLSDTTRRKFRRLKKWHKRYQFTGSRQRKRRHNGALRDVEHLIGNLALPEYVGADAARWLQRAADARLPGGCMAWESLAGGAVLLAATRADLGRSPTEVARYAKTSPERLYAAARKLRVELDLPVEPVPADAVGTVIEALEADLTAAGDAPRLATVQSPRLGPLARYLMALADETAIGTGTPRVAVAASAVYAALKLMGVTPRSRRAVTQAQLAEAVRPTVDMSKRTVSRYNGDLVEAFEARHGTAAPAANLGGDDPSAG